MVKVLVTNDDGIDVHGLTILVEALAQHADVYVVAPKEQQSGKSHSITFMREVTPEERDVKGAVAAWVLDGTPADCVMWAIDYLKDELGVTPDYVISGINLGYNSGLAAYYSGTIAGAREGAINNIRSIALSAGSHKASHFDYMLGMLPQLMEMSDRISPRTILNVNAPDLPSWDIKGVRICEAAPRGYGVRFGFHKTEGGNYQMTGGPDFTDDKMRYDIDWNDAGYVAITPLPTSLADPVALMRLKGQTSRNECLTVIVGAQQKMLGAHGAVPHFRGLRQGSVQRVLRLLGTRPAHAKPRLMRLPRHHGHAHDGTSSGAGTRTFAKRTPGRRAGSRGTPRLPDGAGRADGPCDGALRADVRTADRQSGTEKGGGGVA